MHDNTEYYFWMRNGVTMREFHIMFYVDRFLKIKMGYYGFGSMGVLIKLKVWKYQVGLDKKK